MRRALVILVSTLLGGCVSTARYQKDLRLVAQQQSILWQKEMEKNVSRERARVEMLEHLLNQQLVAELARKGKDCGEPKK